MLKRALIVVGVGVGVYLGASAALRARVASNRKLSEHDLELLRFAGAKERVSISQADFDRLTQIQQQAPAVLDELAGAKGGAAVAAVVAAAIAFRFSRGQA